eukprot:355265-Chlamydomonas_euryale.AAC.17
MDAYDFRSTLTSDGLVAEVAAGTFAFKNKLKAHSRRSRRRRWGTARRLGRGRNVAALVRVRGQEKRACLRAGRLRAKKRRTAAAHAPAGPMRLLRRRAGRAAAQPGQL